MPLALSDFDQTGHDPDALALFVAANPPDWYADADVGGSQSPESGDLGLGDGETLIASLRMISSNRVAMLDRDNPQALDLRTRFPVGASGTWRFHIQTDAREVSTNQVESAGQNVVRWQFTAQDYTGTLDFINAGDRVIVAVTRPTKPVAADLAAAAGTITAALGKQSPGTKPVAASFTAAAGTISALALGKQSPGTKPVAASFTAAAGTIAVALGKQVQGAKPVAASFAGAGGTIAAVALGKQSPGVKPIAASFAAAAGTIAAALAKQALGTQPVAASFAGAGGTIAAALRKRDPEQPRAALAASQASVESGRSVELRWAASAAVSVEIDQGIGRVPLSGTMRVAPEASTTWTLTAAGVPGSVPATAAVTVAVAPRAPLGAVSLLPLNATPFERALEAALAHDIDIPIRKLWSSADCPAAMLPYLAWAMGVEEWDPDWPVAVKRAAVANAFRIHREKGTLAGLKRVLDTAGAEYEYVERPAGVPMTAKLSILNSNAVYLPDIARAVNRVKRVSLELDIELLSAAAGRIPVAAGLGAATVAEIGGLSGYA
ncbi:MAG: phage tail protein I [Bryobacterales bacterium]|nr:phage tail protein I [Bryobacterales bacterium]